MCSFPSQFITSIQSRWSDKSSLTCFFSVASEPLQAHLLTDTSPQLTPLRTSPSYVFLDTLITEAGHTLLSIIKIKWEIYQRIIAVKVLIYCNVVRNLSNRMK